MGELSGWGFCYVIWLSYWCCMIQYILQRKGVDALKKCCKADSTNILLLRITSWKITMLSIKRDGE